MNVMYDLIHAHFFFVDIVGLSDSKMSVKTQVKKINVLNNCVKESQIFKNTPKDKLLYLPTGDGMLLGFLQSPDLPLKLAIELHKKLSEYNKSKIPSETVSVRIGLHSGNVFLVGDIYGNSNFWGPGIVLARRVMDFGDDGHILLSPRMAEDLLEISDEYRSIIKPLRELTIKHGQTILVYSAYGKDFGNKNDVTKNDEQKSRLGEEIAKLSKTSFYPCVEVHLKLKNASNMIVHHKRIYELVNISDEPITHVMHGIGTDVEKSNLEDLHVKIYDENNDALTITRITFNKPYQKEFETNFKKPILKNEQGRKYTLEYEVEEPYRYFENTFLIDCKKFILTFEYDSNEIKPMIYEVNLETEQKKKLEQQLIFEKKKNSFIAKWETNTITKGQTFRLEW